MSLFITNFVFIFLSLLDVDHIFTMVEIFD